MKAQVIPDETPFIVNISWCRCVLNAFKYRIYEIIEHILIAVTLGNEELSSRKHYTAVSKWWYSTTTSLHSHNHIDLWLRTHVVR